MHHYGPDLEAITIINDQEKVIEIDSIALNLEPCFDSLEKEYLIEFFSDEFGSDKDIKNVVENVYVLRITKSPPAVDSYLIQRNGEKGGWGEIEINANEAFDLIKLLSIELEGMEHVAANILLGYLVDSEDSLSFTPITYESNTEVNSHEQYIFTIRRDNLRSLIPKKNSATENILVH